MKFRSLLTLLVLLFITDLQAQDSRFSRVKIWTGETGLRVLSSLGLETDHGDYRKGVWFINDFSEIEIEKIRQSGLPFEILIDDVSKHYRNQNMGDGNTHKSTMAWSCDNGAPNYTVPSNFGLGSYAGYFTYQEMLDHLDSMASKYPSLISIKQALPGGTTHENRPVYYVKISDNPNTDETEPEVLYTAVHHSREPGGMSQLIFYMWYLLENYATDPSIAAIVNNTEMFFVPCLNPDGYLQNETADPLGGGMWRKNRRNNQDGTYGVDLNRNYGYNWGYDDSGSSPSTNSEVYRGPSAFSEPETQLLRDFTNNREFKIALNYHTYGNLLIYPWGYDYSIYTPDSALLSNYGNLLTTYNGYTYGTADQTVGYIVNGSSDDWMYGEQVTKDKIFAMTPECGDASFGFWPPANEIIGLCQNTMFQNITMAQLAGPYARITESSPVLVGMGGDYIRFNLKQLGLDTLATYTISLTALSPNVILTGNPVIISGLSPMQETTDSIFYALTTPMTNGDEIRFLLSLNNGLYTLTDTVVKFFGNPTLVYASDGNSTSGWNAGQWGISNSIYYSPTASLTDSPNGDYGSNENKSIRLSSAVSLANAIKANLSFYARWALEPNFDYVQVQASTNNGVTWTSLCGKYTVEGSPYQIQDEPVYEGFQFNWVKEEISLDDYLGQNILIRFLLTSDSWLEYDGYYFDDLLVTKVLPGTNQLTETLQPTLLTVSPNPAHDYAYISLSSPVNQGKAVVYNSLGAMVYSVTLNHGTTSMRLELSDIKPGVYFVRVESQGFASAPAKLAIY